ncbi:GNAT family N-acetyltransferase [Geomonas sp. Red69]|uniref:GNAT family N-acetyltransferase n=1 Tax=Geomonas diazotrophica TaxID=2843197 RepID=UPI001C108250|nr:GNAT family N-acetyltransferase [Geomonas diazotrophica]MBU5638119.1 GNAT family N-acetyltransferase [Geomonas diazotrophica]
MSDLIYRDYAPADFGNCLELLRTGHTDEFDARRFGWLHLENLLAPSRIAVAECGDRIVGMYAVIRKKALFGDCSYVAGRDVDPVVHPDFRGKGVFSGLLKHGLESFKDIDFYFNFANDLSRGGFIRNGWRQIGTLRDYVYQVGWTRLFSRQAALYLLSRCHYRAAKAEPAVELEFEDLRDLPFSLSALSRCGFTVERSFGYLQWRYQRHPFNQYRYIGARADGRVTKVAIIRIDSRSREFVLCDFLWLDDVQPTLDFLFCHLRSLGCDFKLKMWHTYPGSVTGQFITNRMRSGHQGQGLLVRSGRVAPEGLYDISKWNITFGDAEIM